MRYKTEFTVTVEAHTGAEVPVPFMVRELNDLEEQYVRRELASLVARLNDKHPCLFVFVGQES